MLEKTDRQTDRGRNEVEMRLATDDAQNATACVYSYHYSVHTAQHSDQLPHTACNTTCSLSLEIQMHVHVKPSFHPYARNAKSLC